MTVRVPIKNNLLTWAIERAGYAVEAFLVREPDTAKWMAGEKEPTLKQLEAFARKVHVPFGYLLLQEPPEEPAVLPLFRTAGGAGVIPPAVRDTINMVQRRQEWLAEYLQENGEEPLSYVSSMAGVEDKNVLALAMRNVLGYKPDAPIGGGSFGETLKTLAERIEDAGTQVIFNGVVGNNNKRPIPVNVCRGFVLVNPYAPFIFVNNGDAKAAQLFTLAHEFAHILIGREGIVDLVDMLPADDPLERLCNAAAAEFLVPANQLRKQWATAVGIGDVAKYFGVSQIVIGRRLLDLQVWDKDTFFSFYNVQKDRWAAHKEKTGTTTGGNFYATTAMRIGKSFLGYVDRAAKTGQLPYRQAYNLVDLKRGTYDELINRLKGNNG
jgi:Zn-dependent peptidase ImmA (M78 family)